MKKLFILLMLICLSSFAANPESDISKGVDTKYYEFPYNKPGTKAPTKPAFDENGLNRSPLIILDKDGKPLTPESKVLNRGKDVGCGLEKIGGVFRVVGCK